MTPVKSERAGNIHQETPHGLTRVEPGKALHILEKLTGVLGFWSGLAGRNLAVVLEFGGQRPPEKLGIYVSMWARSI